MLVVNPCQARDYAKSQGVLARTARVDARVLAQFAATTTLTPRPLPTGPLLALEALVQLGIRGKRGGGVRRPSYPP